MEYFCIINVTTNVYIKIKLKKSELEKKTKKSGDEVSGFWEKSSLEKKEKMSVIMKRTLETIQKKIAKKKM